ERARIDPKRLRAAFREHCRRDGPAIEGEYQVRARPALVVEGAGGLLVPLNDRGDLQIDFLKSLRIPFLLVARTALGTINHTLLSLEAMRARDVEIAGVVLNGEPREGVRDAIERFGKTTVLAEVPDLSKRGKLGASAVRAAAQRFDERGNLSSHLTMNAR